MYGFCNMKRVLTSEKLPFCLYFDKFLPPMNILSDKVRIIIHEVELIMPPDYSVEGKLINDISFFKLNNWKLFNKTIISINIKKHILRGILYYGIPKPNRRCVSILKKVCKAGEIDDFTFISFVSAVLSLMKVFQPEINVGSFNVPTCVICNPIDEKDSRDFIFIKPRDGSSSNKVEKFDLRFIKIKEISYAAKAVLTIQKVRENYSYFNERIQSDNSPEAQNDKSHRFLNFPKWKIGQKTIDNWNISCDVSLFNTTAYFGFLLLSELVRSLDFERKFSLEYFQKWKNMEISLIMPIRNQTFDCICDVNFKIERLNTILSEIENDKKNSDSITKE